MIKKTRIGISNMHCSNCSAAVEKHFNKCDGIKVNVILSENEGIFTYDDISWDCSIAYPLDFKLCDTINAYKNRIIEFRKIEKLPHEKFGFDLSKGKYYDNFLIENLISHKFIQSDQNYSKRYIILQDVGLLGDSKAYRFSDFEIISGIPKGSQKCYSVYFIAHEDEYYIIKFGNHINEIIYKNANKIKDILNSFRISK